LDPSSTILNVIGAVFEVQISPLLFLKLTRGAVPKRFPADIPTGWSSQAMEVQFGEITLRAKEVLEVSIPSVALSVTVEVPSCPDSGAIFATQLGIDPLKVMAVFFNRVVFEDDPDMAPEHVRE
jgi:hypothetical protein